MRYMAKIPFWGYTIIVIILLSFFIGIFVFNTSIFIQFYWLIINSLFLIIWVLSFITYYIKKDKLIVKKWSFEKYEYNIKTVIFMDIICRKEMNLLFNKLKITKNRPIMNGNIFSKKWLLLIFIDFNNNIIIVGITPKNIAQFKDDMIKNVNYNQKYSDYYSLLIKLNIINRPNDA